MKDSFSRRDAIKGVASAGTLALIKPASAMLPESPLVVNSAEVEIAVTTVSARTVRITVQPVRDGRAVPLPSDGALLREEWDQHVARMRTLSSARTLPSGNLHVTISDRPLTIRIEQAGG